MPVVIGLKVRREGAALILTGNPSYIIILLPPFSHKIYSNMTAKVQTGPFQFSSQSQPAVDAPSKGIQWPKQELIKYAAFLNFSKAEITSQEDALSWSFLRKMAIFIQTKNPNQCRIFHKKMMEQHSCLDLLVAALRTKIQKFQEWYEHYEPSLRNVKHCLQRETTASEKQPTNIKPQPQKIQVSPIEQGSLYGEKVKQDLRPTDIDYPQENIQMPRRQINYNQTRPVRPAFGFQAFGETDNQRDENALNDYNFFTKRPSICPAFNMGRRESVLDVHGSFLSFLGKLSPVMSGYEQ